MFGLKACDRGPLAGCRCARRAAWPDVREPTLMTHSNTDPKDQPSTHWLALYASKAGPTKLFDSIGFSPINYNVDSQNLLHLSFPLQSPTTFVCGRYCVYIYFRSRNKSLIKFVHLLLNISIRDSCIKRDIYNPQNFFSIFNPCDRTSQCCQLKCQFCWSK